MGFIGFVPWSEAWDDEKSRREAIDTSTICRFGIPVLDDALIGILKNDLIVIGADSGTGKSEMVLDIALHNVMAGKSVAVYYIEGGDEEAIARLKWKMIKDRYFIHGHKGLDMDYRKWRMNMLKSPLIDALENECRAELEILLKDRLQIYRLGKEFTISDLEKSLGYFAQWKQEKDYMDYKIICDLIIIDHLQYFTLANPRNELQEMTNILKSVKDISEKHHIPCILVSHLRKKDKDRGLPSQEDFYGTSNIAKIASQAILVTPSFAKTDFADHKYPTFFRFAKSRTGLKQNYAALCNFNAEKQKYENSYQIYNLKGNFPDEAPLAYHEWPQWARKAAK